VTKTEFDWEPVIEIAGKVAYEIAEKWSVVEADDVKQEIMVHLLEERERLAPHFGDTDFLRKVCWTAGKRFAAKERNHYDLMDDQYFYTPDEVRIALRSFVYSDEEIGQVIGKKDDLTQAKISDNIVTARIDAQKGLHKLSEGYKAVVERVFIYGLPPRDANERRASYRAVDSLTQIMNRNIRTGR
jgi:DNA-directed RNA polymerase specialized sigma24 family protein